MKDTPTSLLDAPALRDIKRTLNDILEHQDNVAEIMDEGELQTYGHAIIQGFDLDWASRKGWEDDVVSYLKLAMQIVEKKTFPWPEASNVKYPMISTAALQFSARAYPTLVPVNGNLVSVEAADTVDQTAARTVAPKLARFLTHQIKHMMPDWEDGMDELLITLPIFGIGYKKCYYHPSKGGVYSQYVHPFNVVVDYWTPSLNDCPRISEIIFRSKRDVVESIRAGRYLDIDLGEPQIESHIKERLNVSKNLMPKGGDDFTPYMLIEQHTYADLDGDGYTEPYTFLVEYSTKKVLRVTPRYSEEDVMMEDGEVKEIKGRTCYVKFPFFPSPDGSFYTRGFGHLLGPLNEAVNTILNQLIDAGTLANTQGGFIGKNIKLRRGETRFGVGEWKEVNTTGNDLRNSIVPLPVREPSGTLFQLMGTLVQSGRELASVAEIFVGKMPGQNTPAYTTQQTIEQGMKLFTAVYKRIYRALTKEFIKIFELNRDYTPEADYAAFGLTKDSFNIPQHLIIPAADPSASSEFELQQKYQQVMPLLQLGFISPQMVTQNILSSLGFSESEIGQLMQGAPATQPKPPSPEQIQAQMAQQEHQMEMQRKAADAQMKQIQQMNDIKHKQAIASIDVQKKKADMLLEAGSLGNKLEFEKQKQEITLKNIRNPKNPKQPKKPMKDIED